MSRLLLTVLPNTSLPSTTLFLPPHQTAPTDRPVTYDGYVDSLRFLDTVFRDKGPFDGVLGFSMGSTIVAALCHIAQQRALQSPDSAPAPAAPGADADEPTLNATPSADPSPVTPSPAHPPGELPLAPPGNGLDPGHYPHIAFGFACLFSGLVPRDVNLKAALTAAPLHTPSFHCWGTGDNIVVPERSAACAGLFTDPVVVTHDGGHLLPSAGPVRKGLKAFLQGRLAALQPQG